MKFAIESLTNGDRLIQTTGLKTIGRAELCVRIRHNKDHDFEHSAMLVLNHIAQYVETTGATIKPGETIGHGWSSLQALARDPDLIELYEPEDPLSEEPRPRMVPGVERTVLIDAAAEDVVRRNKVAGTADFPNRGLGALCCTHLRDNPSRPFQMNREEPMRPNDSGWSFGCGIDMEGHTASDLFLQHLSHIGAEHPLIIPYLLLPLGSMVAFDKEGALVFPPGAEQGQRDPVDPQLFVQDVMKLYSGHA